MVRGAFRAVRRATTIVVGKEQDLAKAPVLKDFLKDLTAQVGTAMPNHIVLGLNPNFFVTEANVICLDGTLTGRTLYISLPLARLLTRTELASVLGHELGHYKGRDTEFSRRFYPIYRGTAESVAGLLHSAGQGTRSIALLPAICTLGYFYQSFAASEAKLGRSRELAADAVGAEITSPRTVGTALLKVCAFAPLWDHVYDDMREALSEGKQFVNLSARWASIISGINDSSLLAGIDARKLSHPTDSHPPLGVRLDALGLSVSDLAAEALKTTPAHPAIELIPEHEQFEKDLTDLEHALLAESLPEQPPLGTEKAGNEDAA
jgi:Zn-dependent protease with chaperone function